MSRHPIDKREPTDGGRVKNFAEVERRQGEEGSHPATAVLHRRPKDAPETNRRAAEFARIDRGHRA